MNKHFTQITTEDDLKIGDKIIIDDESLIIVMLHKIFILRYNQKNNGYHDIIDIEHVINTKGLYAPYVLKRCILTVLMNKDNVLEDLLIKTLKEIEDDKINALSKS